MQSATDILNTLFWKKPHLENQGGGEGGNH